jgi:hypothetical protein
MNPFEIQARAVSDARQRNDRTAETTALTDLGLMHLRNGDATPRSRQFGQVNRRSIA